MSYGASAERRRLLEDDNGSRIQSGSRIVRNTIRIGEDDSYPATMTLGYELQAEPTAVRKERLKSLDMFRGFIVALMIFVDDVGDVFPHIDHSPWNNVTLADFVMPFFLFIAGVSIPFANSKKGSDGKEGRKLPVFLNVLSRSVKMFGLGLVLQGGGFPTVYGGGYNFHTLRIGGILQRIAWAYFLAATADLLLPRLFEDSLQSCNSDAVFTRIDAYQTREAQPSLVFRVTRFFTSFMFHWLCGLILLMAYVMIMTLLVVPDYVFEGKNISCNVNADFSPACNAAGYVDRWLLGVRHMYRWPTYTRVPECSSCSPGDCPRPDAAAFCNVPFDPEGAVSSISAAVSTFIGLHIGHIFYFAKPTADRLWQLIPTGSAFLGIGLSIHYTVWPMNKNLWSPSYLFMMAGASTLALTLVYVLVDAMASRTERFEGPTVRSFVNKVVVVILSPFHWMGRNAIFVFTMAAAGVFDIFLQFFYWEEKSNNLLDWGQETLFRSWIFDHKYPAYADMTFTLVKIAVWLIVSGVLYRRKWFWVL